MRNVLIIVISAAWFLAAPACASSSDTNERRGKITLIEPEDDPDRFVIERDNYNAALQRGPGWLMGQVRVLPVVVGRSFRGFMLTEIFGSDQASGLQAGDIVQRINGRSIERPGQFMRVWKGLEGAEALSIQIVRNRRPLELTWLIR